MAFKVNNWWIRQQQVMNIYGWLFMLWSIYLWSQNLNQWMRSTPTKHDLVEIWKAGLGLRVLIRLKFSVYFFFLFFTGATTIFSIQGGHDEFWGWGWYCHWNFDC